jgi:hypothetical protein
MTSGSSGESDNDKMNVSFSGTCWIVNSRRTYSGVHPITQALFNRMITAITNDINNIQPVDIHTVNVLQRIAQELSSFAQLAQIQTIKDPLQ